MSWHLAKKRFQQNLDRYPRAIRDVIFKQSQVTLPTFEQNRYIPPFERKHKKEEVGLTSGDWVYVVEGEHKGKISKLVLYQAESDTVQLTDIVEPRIVPKEYWVENQNSHILDAPKSILREHVRLAAKDKDDNGEVSFVVADSIVLKDKYYDDRYKMWMPRRFVKHHESIEIPWPKPPTEPDDYFRAAGPDTVFMKSYEAQSVGRSPLPTGVLNELRNRFSSHKRKILTDVDARKLNAPAMPLLAEQKIYLSKKASEPVKTREPLSEEIQDFIGAKMAEHIAGIDNPAMLRHLAALTKSSVSDLKKTSAPDSE